MWPHRLRQIPEGRSGGRRIGRLVSDWLDPAARRPQLLGMPDSTDPSPLEALAGGGKAALARALAALERAPESADTLALLDAAYTAPRARVLGLTGPPGVGKSTLTGRLIAAFRSRGERVGVIAVDPSSRRSGGALLGDRMRLLTDPEDAGVFVRSMAARDRLGGLAEITVAAKVLMRALFDTVLIETVGVGQSEVDVATAADTVIFCVQPASGDTLQFMKAGIIEIPDVAVVTKADLGDPARRALADLKSALSLAPCGGADVWPVAALAVSASRGEGVDELVALLDRRAAWLAEGDRLERARRAQAETWVVEALRARFGRHGLNRARGQGLPLAPPPGVSPFAQVAALAATLER